MGLGYQYTDRSSVDYDLWYLDGLKMPMRGPQTVFDPASRFWTFVGAAQTFGRFATHPYPMLVSSWYGVPHINMGFAGAGPEYFVNHPELIDWINRSEMCFLQIMSGRSTSTTLLKAVGFGGVLRFTEGPLKQQRFLAADAYRKLLEYYGRSALERQISEARENWVSAYRSLIDLIGVPVVGVWVGQEESGAGVERGDLLGGFPHLITENEMTVFEGLGVAVVRAEVPSGGPQLLLDYVTKWPSTVFGETQFPSRPNWSRIFNTYYPSPEMHEGIARKVITYIERKRLGEPPSVREICKQAPKLPAGNSSSTMVLARSFWRSNLKRWAGRFRDARRRNEGGITKQ
jgi:hypothetical protein